MLGLKPERSEGFKSEIFARQDFTGLQLFGETCHTLFDEFHFLSDQIYPPATGDCGGLIKPLVNPLTSSEAQVELDVFGDNGLRVIRLCPRGAIDRDTLEGVG